MRYVEKKRSVQGHNVANQLCWAAECLGNYLEIYNEMCHSVAVTI